MNIMHQNHHNDLSRFQDEMKRVFYDFFPRLWEGREDKFFEWEPAIEVSETDKEVQVEVELPGIKKDDVKISLENSRLTIKGERKLEEKKKDGKYHSTERYYGSFYRAINLPSYVNEKNIKARFKDGILKVTMPKKEEAKPKEIEIGIE